jgi:hypothetical protein
MGAYFASVDCFDARIAFGSTSSVVAVVELGSVEVGGKDFPFDCVQATMVDSNAVTSLGSEIVSKKQSKD